MLAGLLLALGSALAQAAAPDRLAPLERVIELELGPGDAVFAGAGPSKRVEHTAGFSGTLYAWTKSEGVDPLLRIEDAEGMLAISRRSRAGSRAGALP